MRTSIVDVVAVLIFRGTPIVSPLIELLFKPLNLDASTGNTYLASIRQDGVSDLSWNDYLDYLSTELSVPIDSGDFANSLKAVGRRLNADLTLLAEGILEPQSRIEVADLFEIAQSANDGHNLLRIEVETLWHGNKVLAQAFGGSAQAIGKEFAYEQSTSDTLRFAADFGKALGESAGDALLVIRKHVQSILEGISDEALRSRVTESLLRCDGLRPTEEDMEAWSQDEWRDEVAQGDTRLGYEDWVSHQVESTENDAEHLP